MAVIITASSSLLIFIFHFFLDSISFLNTAPQYLAQATAFSPTLSEPYTLIAIGNGTPGFSNQSLIGDDANDYVEMQGYLNAASAVSIIGTYINLYIES